MVILELPYGEWGPIPLAVGDQVLAAYRAVRDDAGALLAEYQRHVEAVFRPGGAGGG